MALEPNGRAPYTSAAAAIAALDAFRERGLGTPISSDVLIRAGVPESIARRTRATLEELELVTENGQPTPTFEAFQQTRGDEEYRARLQEWLRDLYADVLQYADPSQDSVERVQEAFRGYEPGGQRKAMASLLVGLWQYAGLPVAESTSTGSPRRSRSTRRQNSGASISSSSKKKETSTESGSMADLPPGLVGILREIPQVGGSWTSTRREAFLRAFTAMLDYTVQVDDSPPEEAGEDSEISQEQEVSA